MMKNQIVQAKNTFKLQLQVKKQLTEITIDSNFDSGNAGHVELGLNQSIIITPSNDCAAHSVVSHAKGWFYFSVTGAPLHSKIKFIIKRMQQLNGQLKFSQYFRPVCKVGNQEWQRLEQAIAFIKQDDTQLHFDFVFPKCTQVFFAYSYPFSYQECESFLKSLVKEVKPNKNIYYKDEILIRSPEKRAVHLLTISASQNKEDRLEEIIDENLFGYGERCSQLKQNKKIVFISARVHPGQAPASHTFAGLVKFLISNDARAALLRKNFVFKLVPMLNPDGVYHGHYRMDIFGNNLNRFYLTPHLQSQPAIFAVKKLGQYYQSTNRICFYMDLHAHPQKKGNFIYGNSMQKLQEQVQAQLFAKLLSMNCVEFDYYSSSFSKYHMNAKDKNQDLSKEGCGRVVFNTNLQVKYSYTMECGYTSSIYLNEISSIENSHRKFDKLPIIPDQLENIKSTYYNNRKNLYFTIKSYQNLGKNVLVSILDLFQMNPASRVPHSTIKTLAGVKKEVENQINKISPNFKDNYIRTQPTKKLIRMGTNGDRGRGIIRGPSLQYNKDIGLNKHRNKTLTKVNIINF